MVAKEAVAVRPKLLHDRPAAALAETFKALGDVTRVRMLDALARAELCVGDLAELVGLSESAVSHQLRLLRGMRLVRSRRHGRLVFYSLDDDHILRLFEQGLEHVEERERGQRGSFPQVARPRQRRQFREGRVNDRARTRGRRP